MYCGKVVELKKYWANFVRRFTFNFFPTTASILVFSIINSQFFTMCKKHKNMGASLRSACIEDQVFEIFPLPIAVYAEG